MMRENGEAVRERAVRPGLAVLPENCEIGGSYVNANNASPLC